MDNLLNETNLQMTAPGTVTRSRWEYTFDSPDEKGLVIQGEVVRHWDDGSIDVIYFESDSTDAWKAFCEHWKALCPDDAYDWMDHFEEQITSQFEGKL